MVKKLSCGLSLTMKYFFLLIQQLRSISEDLAQTLKKKSGQKLCSSCRKKKTEKNKEASEAEKIMTIKNTYLALTLKNQTMRILSILL